MSHFDEIDAKVRAAIATQDLDHWERVLMSRQISVGPVRTPDEVFQDPVVRSLGILHDDPVPHVDIPIHGLPVRRWTKAPELDEDGAAVRAAGWDALR
jgi:crotonobetainyl-CoA:carnitine CoA-transferase CaiB-like acyl-CoA transferase